MIKWCAACQRFQEESEPFDDYRISHTICPACLSKLDSGATTDFDGLAGIIDFYRRLEAIALAGDAASVDEILEESGRLGIRPLDLMMGLLQPLMAKVGDLWAANQVTVTVEHRFSVLVGDLLASLSRRPAAGTSQATASSPAGAPPATPELVLINAEDNYHTLGLRMAEAYFAISGIATVTVVPGLPTDEVLDLLRTHKPMAVGFSVALPTQMKQVREIRRRLDELAFPPQRILVGGPAVRLGLNPDPSFGIDVCRNLADVAVLLKYAPWRRGPAGAAGNR